MPTFKTQADLQARYLDLLKAYRGAPKGTRRDYNLSDELDFVERLMLDHPPPNRAKGLVHPSRRPPPRLVTLKDLGIETIPERDWDDLIKLRQNAKSGLRPHVFDILDQDGVGSCGVEGICGAMTCVRSVDGQGKIKLNPWPGYGLLNPDGRDRGSSLADNIQLAQEVGHPSQDVWPRYDSRGRIVHPWTEKPPERVWEDAKKYRLTFAILIKSPLELGTCILKDIPVYLGYPGHAFFAVDLLSRVRLVFANSWDESWGDEGFGTLAFSSVAWYYNVYGVITTNWALAA